MTCTETYDGPLALSDILPEPDDFNLDVYREPTDGLYRFDAYCPDPTTGYADNKGFKTEAGAERAAEKWLANYSESDAAGRCKLLGFHWSAVKKATGGGE